MKKVIFSDIDGVLNCRQSYIKNNEDRLFYGRRSMWSKELRIKSIMSHIDFERLELLKYISLRTGAPVVFISAWIGLRDWPLVQKELARRGLNVIEPLGTYLARGEAIIDYVNEFHIDKFIILDDDVFSDYDEELLPFLIHTDFYNGGLTREHVDEAIDYLGDISQKRYLSLQLAKKPNDCKLQSISK